jgi:hypothetical protein
MATPPIQKTTAITWIARAKVTSSINLSLPFLVRSEADGTRRARGQIDTDDPSIRRAAHKFLKRSGVHRTRHRPPRSVATDPLQKSIVRRRS